MVHTIRINEPHPSCGYTTRQVAMLILSLLTCTIVGCTTSYFQIVIPPGKTEVQANAARLQCKKASTDPTSSKRAGGATGNVSGETEGPAREREMGEMDKVIYKNCMEKLGYKVCEIEVFWLFITSDITKPPPRFVRECQK